MGVALDAQGEYRAAEEMLRQALESWEEEDTTPVMNNLALSLAHRGSFDESLTLLRQALILNPENPQVVRNLEVVENLRETIIPKAPVSMYKK